MAAIVSVSRPGHGCREIVTPSAREPPHMRVSRGVAKGSSFIERTMLMSYDSNDRIVRAAALVGSALVLGGCATAAPLGGLYTDLNLPVSATSAGTAGKQGSATCQSILTLLATGDCSFEAAKADGGITTVTHADWKANNILGIIGTYTLTVYGD